MSRPAAIDAPGIGNVDPGKHMLDPQPRHRARWLGGIASILVDFGADTTIEAAALISTNLPATATVRWRVGLETAPRSPGLGTAGLAFDTGVIGAATGEDAGGNVVLLRAGAATGRYLQVAVTAPGMDTLDIGRLVSGPLWRVAHGPAYGMQEVREVLDRRDRNPLTGAEFPVPALANPRVVRFTLPMLIGAEVRGASTGGCCGRWVPLVRRCGCRMSGWHRPSLTGCGKRLVCVSRRQEGIP